MKTKASNLKKIIGIILLLALVILVVVKLKSNKQTASERIYTHDKSAQINVQVETLKAESIFSSSAFSGSFEPNRESKLSAENQGKVNTVFVDLGSSVQKGQALIQLDNSILKLQLDAINVQIEGLEIDVKRYGILTESNAIQGVQLEKAQLGLRSAKIQRETLKDQLNKTTIRAPFAGVITAKFTEEGAFAAPGIPLLQISEMNTLKFTVNVSENDLKNFQLNQEYTVQADVYTDLFLTGKATLIGSKANMGSSFPIQFSVKNTADHKLKAGMFGKVKTQHSEGKNKAQETGIIIASKYIIGSESNPQVYLLQNGKAKLHDVVITKKINNKVLISSGLKVNDTIITSGYINLFNGANVKVN